MFYNNDIKVVNMIDKSINYFLVAYAFCIPISKAGTNFFEILVLILWIYQGGWHQRVKLFKSNLLIISIMSMITISLISVFWASSVSYGLEYIAKYRHFLIILVMYTTLEKRYIKYVISAFLLSMFLSEIISYGIFFEIWNYNNISSSDPTPFMSHTNYSIYLSITIIILILKILYESNLKFKFMYLFFMSTSLINLFINGGRSGQITLVISVFILFLWNAKNKLKLFIIISILAGIFLSISYEKSPNFHNRINELIGDMSNMKNNHNFNGAFATRIALWDIGLHQFYDNPILGVGIGNEMKGEYIKYISSLKYDAKHLIGYADNHNTFITLALQVGFLGFIIFGLIFYSLSSLKIKNLFYNRFKPIFMITLFLYSFTGIVFHMMFGMLFFTLFAGLLNKIAYIEENGEEVEL